jgi:hypothetical protein
MDLCAADPERQVVPLVPHTQAANSIASCRKPHVGASPKGESDGWRQAIRTSTAGAGEYFDSHQNDAYRATPVDP